MRRSANIEMLFTEVPFAERIQKAKDAGFDAVEFAGWLDKDIGQIKQAADKANIKIAAFTGDEPYSPIDPAQQDKYITHLTRSVEIAAELGCKMLVTHSNAIGSDDQILCSYSDLSDEIKLLTMQDTHRKLIPVLDEYDVTVLVEAISKTAHPGVFMDHVDMAAAVVESIASPHIRLLCDLYHMQENGGALVRSLTRYRDIIGHIHFADVPGRHEPGTGEIYFPALAACMENIGYRGMVGFALIPSGSSDEAVKAIMRSCEKEEQNA